MNSFTSDQENFVRYTIVDQQQQGLVLGTFEHPAGWQAESLVVWNYQNTSLPAVFHARAVNPEQSEIFEFLPAESFSWTEPEMGIVGRGQSMGGVVNLPPMSGVDALAHLLIPKYRGDRPGLRIVDAKSEPINIDLPAQNPMQNFAAQTVAIRIEYTENGRPIEEEFRTKHVVYQFPPVYSGWGMSSFTSWFLSEVCCFRTFRENFDRRRETFLKIQSSFQVNPQWSALGNHISQSVTESNGRMVNESIQAGWDRLDIYAKGSREFMENNRRYVLDQEDRIRNSYNTPPPSFDSSPSKSGQSEYTSHEAQIDLIREEESIYNPADSSNEKVGGYYDHIWTDEFGNIRKTNDPNYDPNSGSDGHWTQARKKRIGD